MFSPMHTPNSHTIVPTITEPCRCYGIANQGTDWDLWTSAWSWADRNRLPAEIHLARIRFWIPHRLETEWLLRYGEVAHRVAEEDYI